MGQTIIGARCSLDDFPESIIPSQPDGQYTIGDLHSNPLKLLHFLIKQNVLVLSPEAYKNIVKIYSKPTAALTRNDLDSFGFLLRAAKINPVGLVRLIGDDLADRGKNDYFMLKIIEKLSMANVNLEIITSNHSTEFLINQAKEKPDYVSTLGRDQAQSLYGLGALVKNGVVSQYEIDELTENHYKPALRLLSYSVDRTKSNPELTLFTHAPYGLETIKHLTRTLNIEYRDATVEQLCETIDQINEKVLNEDIAFDDLNKYIQQTSEQPDLVLGQGEVPLKYSVARSLWNRIDPSNINIELPLMWGDEKPYRLNAVHGHIGDSRVVFGRDANIGQSYLPNMTNLDSVFGRPGTASATYHAHFSQDLPAKKIQFKPQPKSARRNYQRLSRYIYERKQMGAYENTRSLIAGFFNVRPDKNINTQISAATKLQYLFKGKEIEPFTLDELVALRGKSQDRFLLGDDHLTELFRQMEAEKSLPADYRRYEAVFDTTLFGKRT